MNSNTSKEQNVFSLEQNHAFINTIISELPGHFDTKLIENKDVVLHRLSDAEINFDKICRTCLTTTNVKYNFDDLCDGVSISALLKQYTSISVQKEDIMPKHICDTCISELLNCYLFKKKCLQSQSTLEEIIKYSSTKKEGCLNENTIQIPFLLQNLEFSALNTSDKTARQTENHQEQKTAQTENYKEQEITVSHPNVKEIINESNENEKEDLTRCKEEEMNYDRNLFFDNLNLPNFETDGIKSKVINEQTECNLLLDCSKCGLIFKTLEEFEIHFKEVRHPKKRRKQPCHICGKVIASHHLSVHMRTHTKEKPYVCKICFKAFSLNCNLKRHFMIHTGEKPYICDFCGKGYIQASSLSEHMCLHTGQKPLLCETCGKSFAYHGNLTEHKCNKSYECSCCKKIFSQISEYQNHLQSHQSTDREISLQLKELHCTLCDKIFYKRRMLNNHMRTHREKTYLCNHCGKGFSHNSSFQIHMKVHTGEKPNSCPDCGKSFSQVGSLKSHMLIHSGQKPFKCNICPKSFTQRSHLRCHMKTHSGERPHKCPYCSKSFALNGTLTVHIRTHTGETPYVCDVCEQGFYHSSTMKKHKRRHCNVKVIKKTS